MLLPLNLWIAFGFFVPSVLLLFLLLVKAQSTSFPHLFFSLDASTTLYMWMWFMNYGIMCTIKIVMHLQYIIIFAWSNRLSFTMMQAFFKHFKFYLCIRCSWCFWFLCVPADFHFSFICDFYIITYTEESSLNSFHFRMSVKAFTALMFENSFAEYRGQR